MNVLTINSCVYFYLCCNYTVKLASSLKTHTYYGNISQPVLITTVTIECHVHPVHTVLLREHNKLSFRKRSTVSHKLWSAKCNKSQHQDRLSE